MDKSNLLKVLDENGLFAEYDDLYRDDVTVRDWVSRHEDLVRSNRAIAQAVQADAPHDVKEGYFTDPDEKRQYEAGEKKYNEEKAKKQQLADEYKRSTDDSYFNTEVGPFQIANEYARKQHIKGNDKLAALNEAAAKAAFATDFAPFPVSLIGPTIRYAQRAGNEDEWVPDAATIADFGTSLLGPVKGAAKTGYEGVKHLAGPLVGRVFNTKLGKNVEKGLEAIDAREASKIAAAKRRDVLKKIDEFSSDFNRGVYTEDQALEFAKSIENEYPELADKLREHVKALVAHRQAADKLASVKASASSNAEDIAKREADDIITSKKLPEAKENARVELKEAQSDAADAVYKNDVYFDSEGNLVFPVKDLKEQYDLYKAAKNGTKLAKVVQAASKPATKAGFIRTYNDDTDYKQYEKDYNQAIEYIIQSNKRQWNAGFKPRGGIELEAWQIAKDRGEI